MCWCTWGLLFVRTVPSVVYQMSTRKSAGTVGSQEIAGWEDL